MMGNGTKCVSHPLAESLQCSPWSLNRGWSRSMVLAEAWPSTVHQPHRRGDRDVTLLNHFFVIFGFRRSVACGRILNSRLEAESTMQIEATVQSFIRPDWGLDEL